MSDRDIISINYFEDKERFADLLNGYLFEGRQIIQPDDFREADSGVLRIQKMPGGQDKNIQAMIRDVVKYLHLHMKVMLIVLQNQTNVHYAMPVRIMNEEATGYHRQWREIAAKHKRKKDLRSDEFLSGFSREDRLTAIVSLVLYFGEKPWDGPVTLREMLNLDGIPGELRELVADYPIHVLEVRRYRNIHYFHTDLQLVFGFLQNAENKENLREYVSQHRQEFENLPQDTYDMIEIMSDSGKLQTLKQKYQTHGGEINMCKAIDDMIEDGRKEGHKEGIQLAKRVFRLNAQNTSVDDIARQCDITVENVLEILDDSVA
ncbi:MAG: transposase [Blautia sp.]|nr:transposase [Blautia sp.]MDY3998876.1 transposase [Blautia sp.]